MPRYNLNTFNILFAIYGDLEKKIIKYYLYAY